jgi:energy-coupling factor transporter transmembrane protein EcfT
MKKEVFNDLAVLLLAFVFIIPIFAGKSTRLYLALLVLSQLFLLLHRVPNQKLFYKLLLFLLIPSASVFISALINTAGMKETPILWESRYLTVYTLGWENAIHLTLRSFCMSVISLSYVLSLRYDRLVYALMQNLRLNTNIGFSLLASFNAFYHLKEEFVRIRLINKMRFGKRVNPFRMLFPLLVGAGRYASQAGLSLESRGLSKQRTYLVSVPWRISDTMLLSSAFIMVLMTLLFFK